MTAAERLAELDDMPPGALCQRTGATLDDLVKVMNEETTHLRAGRFRDARQFTAEKIRLAQDYVVLVRAVQRRSPQLRRDAPEEAKLLRAGHEMLATQMAENLRVIATAKLVTQDLLSDVADSVGRKSQTKTYGASGELTAATASARGLAINRAL